MHLREGIAGQPVVRWDVEQILLRQHRPIGIAAQQVRKEYGFLISTTW